MWTLSPVPVSSPHQFCSETQFPLWELVTWAVVFRPRSELVELGGFRRVRELWRVGTTYLVGSSGQSFVHI